MSSKNKIAGRLGVRASTNERRARRILVVDDDWAGRLAISRVLDRAGYEVATAIDVDSALQEISCSRFDLIISDLRMPDRTGLDLLEEVHRLQPGTPFLLLSGASDRDSKSLALSRGASAFLEKPVRRQTLLETIRRALGI